MMPNTKNKNTEKSKAANGKTKDRNASKQQTNSQLQKFFEDSLKDIYWAEKSLTKALLKMQEAATTEELKNAIEEHLAQTETQVKRLEQVFELIGKKAQAKKCDAMEGLIKEGESIIEETEDGSMTRDVGIIMAAQKVEHYEIATYGGLAQIATTMGLDEAADLLNETLEEEKETDELLTEIAENNINWEAEQETEKA
ncbi:MAG TPA: ferritin-like domain-containing protein [Chitinophagaceae bacterium]|nr:ferritin-like domain-containing protein [Chitinophagaceae bacterium]